MFIFTWGGWIAGRFYRGNRTALMFLFATLQFIVLIAQGRSELLDHFVMSIYQPWFRWYLASDIAVLLLCPMCVLLGGCLARNRWAERG
jgi:integral membrane sensor domain MASE1